MRKAIFMDRDGVINSNVPHITLPEQISILPGVSEAIKIINQAGYLAIIVTNQPVIAKGFCSFEQLTEIHQRLEKRLADSGAHIDGIYTCPHHPEKGFPGEIPELKVDCECRKPKPGLLVRALQEKNLETNGSWMIGDSYTDIEAGKRAGLKTIFLTSGGGSRSRQESIYKNVKPDYVKKDLLDAVSLIFSSFIRG